MGLKTNPYPAASLAVHVGDSDPDGALSLMVDSPKQRDGELPI